MNTPRRTFLKTSLAATASASLGASLQAADASPAPGREYYELRCYRLAAGSRLKANADPALLDRYLEHAMLPALERLGIRTVGAFTELEVDKSAATSRPLPNSPVWVLIPHASLDSFVKVSTTLNTDLSVQKAGAAYLLTPKSSPAFERIDTWLLLAFKSLPRLELPAFSRTRAPGRIFEMRDYESHSELKALSKIAMFDEGETEIMRDLNMSPVFFGQALAGPDLPHLRYMTSAPDLASHLEHWKAFFADPRWDKLKRLPQYADNTSRNTSRFLTPKPYSMI
ncbi:MAG: NIPSNAP family protein [Opitutaceae bacterium]|nr:NIPSNAP family protein [Opitutaceae bacterium]